MANYEYRRSHSLSTRIATYLLSLLFALGAPISAAQSSNEESLELAGHIIVVSGSVIARDTSGDRPLRRKDPIYVGDIIFTDVQASTQIRMVDQALIALKESTEFAIVAYQYEQDASSDQSTIELIQGGFRTITGRIGQQNREAYTAQISDFATIGIRGTDFEVVITDNGVFTGVYDGGTTVSNGSGSLDLGIRANYDFAQVATPNSPPTGLLQQPPGLGIAPFAATTDEEEEESTDDENQNSEPENNDDADSNTEEPTDDQAGDDDAQADADTSGNSGDGGANANGQSELVQDVASISSNQGGNTEEEPSSSSLNLQTPTTELAIQQTQAGTSGALARGSQEDAVSNLTVNPSETSTDGSVSCATDSSLCLQLFDGQVIGDTDTNGGDDSSDNNENTNSGNNGNGNGNSGDNGNSGNNGNNGNNGNTNSDSDDNTTTTTVANNDDGTTTTTTITTIITGGDDTTTSNNGNGNGNSGNNGNGNSASGDDTSSDGNDSTTDDTTDDNTTDGSGNNGNGNGNSDNNGNGNSASGDDTSSDGNDSTTDDTTDNNTTDGSGNNGNGNGNSGNNGNSNSGNDDDTTTTTTTTTVTDNDDGTTTTTITTVTTTDGEDTTTDNSGNNGNGNGNSGNNGNGNSGGNGQTLLKPELTVDIQGVSWGRWDNSVDDNFVVISQVDDNLVLVATSDYLAQVNPAPIGKLTGSHNYATTIASSFIGNGSAGDISSLIAGMSVDFETGVIDQGTLAVLVADQAWNIEFEGSVNNGLVELNASSGQLLDSTGIISNSINANLGGVFSGNTGSAFVGGFDLIDEMNTYNTVNGLFTIER